MRRRTFLIAATFLILAGAAGGTAYFIWFSGPLTGSWRHDFGDVNIPDLSTVEVDHTFVLRNRTDHEIHIRKLTPMCGCTHAGASTDRVEPGQEVSIAVRFELSGMGRKHVNIELDLGEDGMKTLTVVANRIPVAARRAPSQGIHRRDAENAEKE